MGGGGSVALGFITRCVRGEIRTDCDKLLGKDLLLVFRDFCTRRPGGRSGIPPLFFGSRTAVCV